MTMIRLTIAILLLTGIASASVDYQKIDTTGFAANAAAFEGQFVAVSGKICAINADGKSVHLFDSETKALIEVDLSRLQKSQRRSLILNPVQQISVYGKAELKNGKLVIGAHRVEFTPVSRAGK